MELVAQVLNSITVTGLIILLEKIREDIDTSYQARWEEVAMEQRGIFLGSEGELMKQQAGRMAATYNLEIMEQLINKVETSQNVLNENCIVCGKKGDNRCSR